MTYDQRFFDGIREGIKRSAKSLVPLLVSELSPAIDVKSVIDVGAGEGLWMREFDAWDFRVLGMDGWAPTKNQRPKAPIDRIITASADVTIPRLPIVQVDLEKPIGVGQTFGLVLCLEVAEHLTPERGPSFIADLCKLSDLIVFSAAIPGQRGVNHLNEQWPAYWVNEFLKNGFYVSGTLRWMIWEDEKIEPWYRQNLLIATKHPERLPNLFDTPLCYPWPVVHPSKWCERTGEMEP